MTWTTLKWNVASTATTSSSPTGTASSNNGAVILWLQKKLKFIAMATSSSIVCSTVRQLEVTPDTTDHEHKTAPYVSQELRVTQEKRSPAPSHHSKWGDWTSGLRERPGQLHFDEHHIKSWPDILHERSHTHTHTCYHHQIQKVNFLLIGDRTIKWTNQ